MEHVSNMLHWGKVNNKYVPVKSDSDKGHGKSKGLPEVEIRQKGRLIR